MKSWICCLSSSAERGESAAESATSVDRSGITRCRMRPSGRGPRQRVARSKSGWEKQAERSVVPLGGTTATRADPGRHLLLEALGWPRAVLLLRLGA
eukprot:5225692-Prymnesium_polylepis.2